MDKRKADIIFLLTNEIHDDIDELYELMMDEADESTLIIFIDKTVAKLRVIKTNLTNKDNEV